MIVCELIEVLEGFDEEMEVRLAIQPNWPFEHNIDDVLSAEVHDDLSGQDVSILYIGEGHQLGYLPGVAKEALGW